MCNEVRSCLDCACPQNKLNAAEVLSCRALQDPDLSNVLPGCKVVAPGTAVCRKYECQEQTFRHNLEEAGVCNVCVELQSERPSRATLTTASISNTATDNSTASLLQSAGSTFYSIALDDGGPAECCPINISNTVRVVEATASFCGVRCRSGSWWDPLRANCSPCSPKPEHSRWSDGCVPANRVFHAPVCVLGFRFPLCPLVSHRARLPPGLLSISHALARLTCA